MVRKSIQLTALIAVMAVLVVTPAVFAASAEAQKVMDEMQAGKPLDYVTYSFIEVGYDDASNVLNIAVADGQHFEDTQNVYFTVPVADINDVTVVSNADKTIQDGKLKNIDNDMATNETGFTRIKQGCSIKLWAKDPSFAWAVLKEGDVMDGKLVSKPAADDMENLKTVEFGFYDCPHAREVQNAVHDLVKSVKKGS